MQKIYFKIDFSLTKGFKKIYSGFSGGADSTALLVALAKESSQSGFELEAVHFEHGIRGESSKEDAEWCRNFCEIRKIPFRQIDLEIGPDCKNVEATARRLRLAAWQEIVNTETEAVAVGQHADDRIENIFLRMMRGANVTGLTSMRSSQKIERITVIRPLLGLRRFEIEKFLEESEINDWRTDHTNFENIYRRNFIRNEVLPLIKKEFPDVDKAFLKSISALQADAEFLEQHSQNRFREMDDHITDSGQIKIHFFMHMEPAIMARVLRQWLTNELKADTIPNADFLKRFSETVKNYNIHDGKQVLIPLDNEIAVAVEKTNVFIKNTNTASISHHAKEWDCQNNKTIQWNDSVFTFEKVSRPNEEELTDQSHLTVYFAGAAFPEQLIIRNRIPGDRMIPFGHHATVKIKKLLQDTDLSLDEKKRLPIVTTPEGEIIWIPGVRRANFANITDNRKCCIKLYAKNI